MKKAWEKKKFQYFPTKPIILVKHMPSNYTAWPVSLVCHRSKNVKNLFISVIKAVTKHIFPMKESLCEMLTSLSALSYLEMNQLI